MGRPKNGRPSKYKKEFPAMVYEYVNKCKETATLPFIKEWCYQNGINPDKIERYTKLNNSFRRAIEYLKYETESMLVRNGMKRKYDPSMAKFVLAANHGYVETSKQINEGNQPVTIQVDMSGGYIPPQVTTGPQKPINPKAKPN